MSSLKVKIAKAEKNRTPMSLGKHFKQIEYSETSIQKNRKPFCLFMLFNNFIRIKDFRQFGKIQNTHIVV